MAIKITVNKGEAAEETPEVKRAYLSFVFLKFDYKLKEILK